jgi:hypothetical protein
MASKTNGSTSAPVAKAPWRQRLAYALWAITFIALGALLLVINLQLVPTSLRPYWPILLIVLGALIAWRGGPAHQAALPTFSIDRGDYKTAGLLAQTGSADLTLNAFVGSSQLMIGQFPAYAGPRTQTTGSRLIVQLDRRFATLFLTGHWQASLAKGLPWDMTLRSTLGDFDLNLRDLTLTKLDVRSWLGNVDITLPATGQGEAYIALIVGNLTLRIPEGVAVKLILNTGWLARATLDPHRFIQVSPTEWVTPHFSASPHRYALTLSLTTGDLHIA